MSVRIDIDTERLQADRDLVASQLRAIRKDLRMLQEMASLPGRQQEGSLSAFCQQEIFVPADCQQEAGSLPAACRQIRGDIEGALSVCAYLDEYVFCMEDALAIYRRCEQEMTDAMARVMV